MRTLPVVVRQPARQRGGSSPRRAIGAHVRPFTEERLNEAFRLAVCSWGVWFGAAVFDGHLLAGLAELSGAVAGAVVGEQGARTPIPCRAKNSTAEFRKLMVVSAF